ncbi:amidohydrolase family protein [Pseudoflavitalea sp. G-6-1-2]|uniref:amidohydrolase family protein n=1 Tax=Pseudoflavitalea sp. G-6-1-2 TaxID=2728841 RepID=UPI00146CDEAD|nr:amidohydrolase family protein [Pseudoflavitalea sp. G-6-1-2]NML20391.1 amidohydrolase family protein [Pseudoflavitalea sp. G-6-1-2]
MAYRKFKADQLFTGNRMLDGGEVLITTEQGWVEDIVPASEAGDDVQVLNGLLSPGFVNAHCHLELSHMKGRIQPGTGMVDFLLGVMKQRNFPQPEVQSAVSAAAADMWNDGIEAVGDICNTPDTISEKTDSRLHWHNFIETMGFIPATAAQRFAHAKSVFDQFEAQLPGHNSIVPHAPYSVSAALMQLIADHPGNQLLSLHNQESDAEAQFLLDGTGPMTRLYGFLGIDLSFYQPSGKQSPQLILPALHANQSMILVHDVKTGASDLQWITGTGQWKSDATAQSNLFFCLCPNANLYIGNGLPDIDLLRTNNAAVVLGTDSLSSNHQLSILEEVKTIAHHFPHIPLVELLQWATLNGAKALQLDGIIGSFEKGKKPGVVLIENLSDGLKTASAKRLI